MHCLPRTSERWATSLSCLYQAPSRRWVICPRSLSHRGPAKPGVLALSPLNERYPAGIQSWKGPRPVPKPTPSTPQGSLGVPCCSLAADPGLPHPGALPWAPCPQESRQVLAMDSPLLLSQAGPVVESRREQPLQRKAGSPVGWVGTVGLGQGSEKRWGSGGHPANLRPPTSSPLHCGIWADSLHHRPRGSERPGSKSSSCCLAAVWPWQYPQALRALVSPSVKWG